ncbi:hypothetical protein CKF94_14845 [Vibrio coralliilyticus]|nr:hypothetical protein DVV14_15130 [Vibrio coralliilyticus]KPH25982.1 hypothetical protein ADU60_12180 [Vibrio coralliilyticus]PAU37700.1 hypothetical protein CKF94_14845 [Vibrio coralliilyticus]
MYRPMMYIMGPLCVCEEGVVMSVVEFFHDEEGLTVVEYVVGAGLIVAGFAGLFIAIRGILSAEFATIFS